jgi:tRNA U34 5-methylaminomethyl-2-thiouridine-forming methyltransferase MnmC
MNNSSYQIIETSDGSSTIFVNDLDEHYHSTHGAIQEAKHVFLKNGLERKSHLNEISIFEVGFGTGLNAFLTSISSSTTTIKYDSLELFPLNMELIESLNYASLFNIDEQKMFLELHKAEWDNSILITPNFQLKKINQSIFDHNFLINHYDIIYFDAFGPRAQPEMWAINVFEKMYSTLKNGGFLVTYCAKGQVKRDLKAVGFDVVSLPGPPGKREMTQAWKV